MFLIQYLGPQKRLNVNSIKMIFIAHEYCNRFVRKMLELVLLKKILQYLVIESLIRFPNYFCFTGLHRKIWTGLIHCSPLLY